MKREEDSVGWRMSGEEEEEQQRIREQPQEEEALGGLHAVEERVEEAEEVEEWVALLQVVAQVDSFLTATVGVQDREGVAEAEVPEEASPSVGSNTRTTREWPPDTQPRFPLPLLPHPPRQRRWTMRRTPPRPPPSSLHPSVFPIHPPSSSSLPSSYLPSSPLPPPLPPQPSSHETAHAFGFTVDGASTSSPTSYTPGFTGPSVPPRPSLPSPSSSPAPSAPSKLPASSAPSPPPSSSRYSPAPASSGGPPALPPVLGKSRVVAVKEADRLMKHAASALSFDDIDTSIAKLQQAVALLYPHKTP